MASRDSHGFNQRDLSKVRSTAAAVAFDARGSTSLQPTDLLQAARAVRPSALSTVEVAIPNVKWSDIGGSDEAKSVLKEYVEWCLGEQRWVFESLRLPPPKGVLLYGPPGCSKTMLAKALANESKMNFVSVKGPEVFSKWVGDSEKAVRRVFAQARAAAPCVVFIDELDGMCGHRGSGGVGDRVISQLLTELDGLPAAISSKSDNIILVAATNRPENIDGAVLRPGRIDRRVYVGLPTIGERRAIAELSLKRIPCLASEVNPDLVASRTDGYTGAEVVAVCKETSFQALTRSMEAESVLGVDFEAALVKVRPRVSAEDVNWYLQWGKQSSV
jgi:SpoVK/Ycf46/Vps4 family AAA+-type ATPase